MLNRRRQESNVNYILKELQNKVVGSFILIRPCEGKHLILNISVYVYVHIHYYKSLSLY